jgi:hypothetical protein
MERLAELTPKITYLGRFVNGRFVNGNLKRPPMINDVNVPG